VYKNLHYQFKHSVHSIAENFYSLPLLDRHNDRTMTEEENLTTTKLHRH